MGAALGSSRWSTPAEQTEVGGLRLAWAARVRVNPHARLRYNTNTFTS